MSEVRDAIARAGRLVVKVGSSALTTAGSGLDVARLDALVDAIADRVARGTQIVLVSSGAIGAGLAPLSLGARPKDLATQQAAASAQAQADALRNTPPPAPVATVTTVERTHTSSAVPVKKKPVVRAKTSARVATDKTTTTTKATPVKTPAQIRLLVLNAGAPTGSAAAVSTTLRSKGYTNQGAPGDDPSPKPGKRVLCRAGLTREAATLAVLLGMGTTKGTIGSPAPPGSTGYDCVVEIGAG